MRLPAALRATVQRSTLPLLIGLSVAIIALGRADRAMLDSIRTTVSDALAPVFAVMSRPVSAAGGAIDQVRGFFSLYSDNARLETENARLLQWQEAALRLSADNQQLRGLLKALPEPNTSYITARVIANSGGAYVRTVMINAGSDDGIGRGQAAIAGDGLVGRLTEIGGRAARVLLITDLNSRVPVVVESSRANAVLAGDNSDRPRLLYLSAGDTIKLGDRVVTSGEGGVFPPGLPVGVVAALEPGGPRVEPYADLAQLGYLLVVDYGLAGRLPQPVPTAPAAARRGKPAASDKPAIP